MSTSCKKDYEKLSQTAASLSDATQFDRSEGNQKLLKALQVYLHRDLFSLNLKGIFWRNQSRRRNSLLAG